MRSLGRRSGFTLAELLVGLAVTSIVMTAVVAIFIGVQRSYQAETEVKTITESGRGAIMFLDRVVPMAGYGVDPRVAFDVAGTLARDNEDITTLAYTPTQPAIAGDGGTVISDDLAFRYRDPVFLRAGRIDASRTTVTVDTPLGVALPTGKMLMVGCKGGAIYTMVRVAGAAAATDTSITVVDATAPFSGSSASCLQGVGAESPWVFMIQEHRLRIVNLGGRPWLVSFRNLDANPLVLNLDNFDPIAPDVEGFQVAFGMNRARPGVTQTVPDTLGNSNFIIGDAPSEVFFAQPAGVLNTLPDYKVGYDDPTRFTQHPANIRSVHVALVLRSSRGMPNAQLDLQTGNLFNSSFTPARDPFRRSTFHTAINTPNLNSRTGFVPALRSAADTRDLNSWGG